MSVLADASSHERLMRRAIELAIEGVRSNAGGPFGCVIARAGEIVGDGRNQVTSTNDPTAHAEVVAIRQACERLGNFELTDCVLYTSCEPCPMCLGAIYWARIPRVFIAADRADAASAGFDDAFIYEEICLPADARQIRLERLLRDEALASFREWDRHAGKTLY